MKSSELTHEEVNLLKDDLNVSCLLLCCIHFDTFFVIKEWQDKMATKVDHVTSHDNDLPPIRSGHVSMKQPPVSGIKYLHRL